MYTIIVVIRASGSYKIRLFSHSWLWLKMSCYLQKDTFCVCFQVPFQNDWKIFNQINVNNISKKCQRQQYMVLRKQYCKTWYF